MYIPYYLLNELNFFPTIKKFIINMVTHFINMVTHYYYYGNFFKFD
jgi:hypothetical protein